MKKWLIFIMLLLVPIAYAVEGNIDVYSFKVYAGNEFLQVDWNDDEFDVEPGTTAEIQIRLENNYNQTVDVELTGILYEIGDDIQRDETVELEEDERRTVVLEYFIPTDVREGIYELEIEYDYRVDSTDYLHRKTFELNIREEHASINEILTNISKKLAEEIDESNEIKKGMSNLSNVLIEWGDCERALGAIEFEKNISNKFIAKYDSEVIKNENLTESYSTCVAQKDSMYSQSQLNNEVDSAIQKGKREQKQVSDMQSFAILVGVGVYFWMKRKKETVGGEGEGKSLTGTWGK